MTVYAKNLITALFAFIALASTAWANPAPDAFVRQMTGDVLTAAKADKRVQDGETAAVVALVDAKVMPHVDFETVTRSAVGPQWRSASAEQRTKLQAEFKSLLVRVYAGAFSQIKDQTVEITKTQAAPGGSEVVVQSEVRGAGDPVKLDYRLLNASGQWKIIDVNVGGIWLVTSYRSQFAPILGKGGIDALIAELDKVNKQPPKS